MALATERRGERRTGGRQLAPVAFGADGRLLCVAPDGLAWLAPDPREGYVVEATRRLPDGFTPTGHVARLGNAEVITANDRQQQPHLLIVRPDTLIVRPDTRP